MSHQVRPIAIPRSAVFSLLLCVLFQILFPLPFPFCRAHNVQTDTYLVEFETYKFTQQCHASQLFPVVLPLHEGHVGGGGGNGDMVAAFSLSSQVWIGIASLLFVVIVIGGSILGGFGDFICRGC